MVLLVCPTYCFLHFLQVIQYTRLELLQVILVLLSCSTDVTVHLILPLVFYGAVTLGRVSPTGPYRLNFSPDGELLTVRNNIFFQPCPQRFYTVCIPGTYRLQPGTYRFQRPHTSQCHRVFRSLTGSPPCCYRPLNARNAPLPP